MKYHLVALFTIAVWGITFVSTKVLLVTFSPLWILMLRFVVAFGALCVLRPRILKLKERKHEWLFVFAGLTGIAAYYLLENIALVYTTATAVGVIVAASPLFTALLSAAMGDRSSMNVRFFLGFVLAMAGLTLVGVSSGGGDVASSFGRMGLLGNLLALFAALVWAVYSLLVKRISDLGYGTIAVTKRSFLWGVAFIVPATIVFGGPFPDMQQALEPVNLANLAFLGFVASAACFVTWGLAVKHLGPATTTTYIYLVPAITAMSSILILGEPVTVGIVMGLAMTIGGLFLSNGK